MMTRAHFMDSIFELADMWTRTVEPKDYVEFLRTLFLQVATLDPDGKFYIWKADQDIGYGGYQAEEEEEDDEDEEAGGGGAGVSVGGTASPPVAPSVVERERKAAGGSRVPQAQAGAAPAQGRRPTAATPAPAAARRPMAREAPAPKASRGAAAPPPKQKQPAKPTEGRTAKPQEQPAKPARAASKQSPAAPPPKPASPFAQPTFKQPPGRPAAVRPATREAAPPAQRSARPPREAASPERPGPAKAPPPPQEPAEGGGGGAWRPAGQSDNKDGGNDLGEGAPNGGCRHAEWRAGVATEGAYVGNSLGDTDSDDAEGRNGQWRPGGRDAMGTDHAAMDPRARDVDGGAKGGAWVPGNAKSGLDGNHEAMSNARDSNEPRGARGGDWRGGAGRGREDATYEAMDPREREVESKGASGRRGGGGGGGGGASVRGPEGVGSGYGRDRGPAARGRPVSAVGEDGADVSGARPSTAADGDRSPTRSPSAPNLGGRAAHSAGAARDWGLFRKAAGLSATPASEPALRQLLDEKALKRIKQLATAYGGSPKGATKAGGAANRVERQNWRDRAASPPPRSNGSRPPTRTGGGAQFVLEQPAAAAAQGAVVTSGLGSAPTGPRQDKVNVMQLGFGSGSSLPPVKQQRGPRRDKYGIIIK